jgi:hypothetical protein
VLGVLEFFGRMTIFTGEKLVRSVQRKLCQAMVKNNFFDPAILIVTFCAVFTLLPIMCVVKTVAAGTIGGRFGFEKITLMAGFALQILVFSL